MDQQDSSSTGKQTEQQLRKQDNASASSHQPQLSASSSSVHTRNRNYVRQSTSAIDKSNQNQLMISRSTSHHELKRFQCLICNKRFSRCDNLRKHHRIHTGEKPYSCSYCGKSFRWISALRNHEDIHVVKSLNDKDKDKESKEKEDSKQLSDSEIEENIVRVQPRSHSDTNQFEDERNIQRVHKQYQSLDKIIQKDHELDLNEQDNSNILSHVAPSEHSNEHDLFSNYSLIHLQDEIEELSSFQSKGFKKKEED